jgi:dipeptidyl aminopeptidase/acylaminoacyl peptidase
MLAIYFPNKKLTNSKESLQSERRITGHRRGGKRAELGHWEVEYLEAGLDYVTKMGVADPDRLGAGGWSYGDIMTDYRIASDRSFKARTSGAALSSRSPCVAWINTSFGYDY